jgi:hypothetical protein
LVRENSWFSVIKNWLLPNRVYYWLATVSQLTTVFPELPIWIRRCFFPLLLVDRLRRGYWVGLPRITAWCLFLHWLKLLPILFNSRVQLAFKLLDWLLSLGSLG